MNDLGYVSTVTTLRAESEVCPRCVPPVLCARHVLAFTAARRTRETTLLRGSSTAPVR